jgi:hypothetical protein
MDQEVFERHLVSLHEVVLDFLDHVEGRTPANGAISLRTIRKESRGRRVIRDDGRAEMSATSRT